ncbi:urea ABC transporter permease subunit UrtB [Sulfurospirillum sp. 1612]|uniref:urea ABC transporter permease subunit UrtB n=1 Tax=Sulfurospirillum sp. 1612 TaxID=3094835 RepID=UPI002F952A9B
MKLFIKIILLNLLLFSSLFSSDFVSELYPFTKSYSFKQKEQTIQKLAQQYSNDEVLHTLFTSLLDGTLYFIKESKKFVVVIKKDTDAYEIIDLMTKKRLKPMSKYLLQRVKTNNKLRSITRSRLADLNLFSKNQDTRLKSAKNILKNLNQDSMVLINKALKSEKDASVIRVLGEAKSILQVNYGTQAEQLVAVQKLGDFLSPQALEALQKLHDTSANQEIKKLAATAIATIQSKKSFYAFVEKAFFGLSLGSILLLAAIGLAITFGVMKVINMAHGEMMMIGAYTTYTLQQILPNMTEYSVILAIPLAFIVSGLIGIILERLVIRHLYGRPLETLLATFGISLILQQLVRSIYSPLNQEVKTPQWMSGAWEINGALSLTYNRLYIIIFALLVFAGILLLLNKTSLGLKVRAVTQNREMAQAMGIRTGLIDALTFGLGSGIAGIAGVALSQLTNVGPNLGQSYIVDSFMVVVFGGVGNLWGTLISALTLGEINKFIEPVAGAVLAKVIILVFIILFIQKRPRGLFPQKGRDAQD